MSLSLKKIVIGLLFAGSCSSVWFSGTAFSKSSSGLMDNELITADQLQTEQEARRPLVILDARSKKSFDEGHIRGAVLPLSDEYYKKEELFRLEMISSLPPRDQFLEENMNHYPKDRPIVTYCNTNCGASAVLFFELKRLGFKDVRVMEEGFQAWESKGYPVAKNEISTGGKTT